MDGKICGVTQIGPTGIEWICVKPPHAEIYTRKTPSKNHHRGDPIYSNNPRVDQHHFQNRWPNREKEKVYGHEEAEASGSSHEEGAFPR